MDKVTMSQALNLEELLALMAAPIYAARLRHGDTDPASKAVFASTSPSWRAAAMRLSVRDAEELWASVWERKLRDA
jgi:hypothetical protein